jgi:hypothetical protein
LLTRDKRSFKDTVAKKETAQVAVNEPKAERIF